MLSVSETKDFPSSSAGKEFTCNPEDPSLNPGLGRSPGERIGYPLQYWAFLMTQTVKNPPGFDPWVEKIPWRWEWLPTPVFLPRKIHGQRSLVGYSPWGHKKSLTLSLHFSFMVILCLTFLKTTKLFTTAK